MLTPYETKNALKQYSESPFHADVKNGLTIWFSYKNDGENKCKDSCKIRDTEETVTTAEGEKDKLAFI